MNHSTHADDRTVWHKPWRKILSVVAAAAITVVGVHVVHSHYLPAAFADPAASVSHGDKYATGVRISGTAGRKIPFDQARDLKENERFIFNFDWAVGTHERPKPGDTMTITLPEWMLSDVSNQSVKDANGYTNCVVTAKSTEVVCTFSEAVATANLMNLRGSFQAELTAQGGKSSSPIIWGGEVNAYKRITGKDSGVVEKAPIVGAKVDGTEVKKGGVVASEHTHQGQTYLQVLWTVELPPAVVGNEIKVKDQLQPLNIEDPDTGKTIELPQFLPPGHIGGGRFTVMRRDHPDRPGDWSDHDGALCQPGGDYHKFDLDCGKKVAVANWANGAIENGDHRETEVFTLDGVPGEHNWDKSTNFTLTMSSPKEGAAYRISFYTWIPKHPAIKGDQGVNNPKLHNTVVINDKEENQPAGAASIRAIFSSEAFADLTKTRIIVRKEVEGPAGVESDVESFPLVLTQDNKADQACNVTVNQPCVLDIEANTRARIVENAVAQSQHQWQPGVFTLPASQIGKNTTYDIQPNQLNITNGAPGEAITFILTNRFTAAAAEGKFKVRKQVNKPNGLDLAQAFNFNFRCEKGTDVDPILGNFTIPATGGEYTSDRIPAGFECTIIEDTTVTRNEAEGKNHTHAVDEESKVVTIEAGQDKQVEFTNTYSPVATGFLAVQKNARGLSQGATLQTVNVSFTCNRDSKSQGDQQFVANTPKIVPITVGGQAQQVGEFYVGTVCTFDEVEDSAKVADHTGPEVSYMPGTQRIEIGEGQGESNTAVITNTYTPVNFGVLKVKKTASVAGATTAELPAEIPANVTVKLRCDKPSRAGKYTANTDFAVEVPQNGAEVSVDEGFAHGTSCAYVSEEGAGHANYQLATQASQAVTIGADADANRITVTNTYTPKTNTFTVVKNVQKPAELNLTKPFRFTYTCNGSGGEETGELEIPVAGGRVETKPFAVGTECTITEQVDETAAEAKAANHIHQVDQPSQQVTIKVNQKVEAAFTNTYREEEKGTLYVNKAVAGLAPGAELESVTVAVTCDRDSVSTGEKALSKDVVKNIQVSPKAAAVNVGEFYAGTQCRFEEVADSANVDNHATPAVTYNPANQIVSVQPGDQPDRNRMDITNTYTENPKGVLFVKKDAVGVAQGVTAPTVTVDISCNAPLVGETAALKRTVQLVPGAEATRIGEFYAGAACTVVEQADTAQLAEHKGPVVSYEPAGGAITVKPGATSQENLVTVTNNYTEVLFGALRIKKNTTVAGIEGAQVPQSAQATVTAKVTCDRDSRKGKYVRNRAFDVPVEQNGPVVVVDEEFEHGTVCSVSEEIGAEAQAYTPKVSIDRAVTIGADEAQNLITISNTYEPQQGSFTVIKRVDDVAGALPAGTSFHFDYTCVHPQFAELNKSGTLTIQGAGQAVVDGLSQGMTCTVVEKDAGIDHVEWKVTADQQDAQITVADGQPATITFTNTYTVPTGGLSVTKKVVREDALGLGASIAIDPNKEFTFTYTCELPGAQGAGTRANLGEPSRGELKVKAGGTESVTRIVAGSSCLVQEVAESAQVDNATVTLPRPQRVDVDKRGLSTLSMTNTYAATTGSITVHKQLEGSAKGLQHVRDHAFDMNVHCTKEAWKLNKALKVSATTPVTVTDIPAGANCAVTEELAGIQIAGVRVDTDPAAVTNVPVAPVVAGQTTDVTVRNVVTELGRVQIVKTLAGLSAGQGEALEFQVSATWQDKNEHKEHVLRLKANQPVVLPDVPVGTVVKLVETKPADTAFAVWKDPEFILGETSVNDADGAGVVTVAANTFTQPMALELRNTANPPWWWGFVALIPLAGSLIPMVPQPPAPPAGANHPAPPAENGGNAAAKSQAKGQAKQAAGEPQLAATGADVRVLSVLALLLVTSGAVLALRRRNS
ncbi:DUF5979 domain-containing protein [Corynebacterium felinum]|uniref:T surface-antigen of pili n=1 Tax=Corynebacterium felinum TaxID=131318 RepID=A0ABU2B5B8_9CORY|nr:DUF5979 domain-containing protein [Corynebacterium felinum]MDF5821460.1 DUF5979 domain-containing protein [Corynebacterium felinum]MDR7353812.1 hypothetical protein [Corynebacterium felinum]WJY95990.1 T surface-antigen of pili [Corynebacterium felinum]